VSRDFPVVALTIFGPFACGQIRVIRCGWAQVVSRCGLMQRTDEKKGAHVVPKAATVKKIRDLKG
jgi:hypothetical protein